MGIVSFHVVAALLFAAAAAPSAALADVLTVTDGSDDPSNPQPGTLRYVLTREAKAGDTIRFQAPLEVTLSERAPRLEISADLTGLRLEGVRDPQGTGAVVVRGGGRTMARLSIAATGVVVQDIDFLRLTVAVGDPLGTVRDARVTGCRFSGLASVEMRGAADCVIEGNEFDVDPKLRGAAIELLASTDRCRIVGNTLRVGGSGRRPSLISASGARACTIEDNVLEGGGLSAREFDGVIRRNRVSTGALEILGAASVESPGAIEIRENDALSVSLFAYGGGSVAGNRIGQEFETVSARDRPTTTLRVYTLGEMVVEDNQVNGGSGTTLFVADGPGAESVLVRGNTLTAPARVALIVNTSAPTQVVGNTVQGAGSSCRDGIRIVEAPPEGVRVEGNTVKDVASLGISVLAKQRARLVANSVLDCRGTGVAVGTGAVVDIEGGSVERSGRQGIAYFRKATGKVSGATVRGNAGAGIFVDVGARVEVARNVLSGNVGAGIDLAPNGVTPNAKRKAGNDNVPFPTNLAFDDATGRITGKAEPGARIDGYAVEEGERRGNLANGEGVAWLGEVLADANGDFTFPAGGRAPCPPSKKICFTATRLPAGVGVNRTPVTSEFSGDVECTPGAPIALVSQSSAGAPGNASSLTTDTQGVANRNVSDDGRWVVFGSSATNLVADDTNGLIDLFLRDTVNGVTTRVTRTSGGGQVGEPGLTFAAGAGTSISADGRFVAYASTSGQVHGGITESTYPGVVLFDAQTETTIPVAPSSVAATPYPSGAFATFGGLDAMVSGDGSAVIFTSIGPDWTPGDAGFDADAFVWTLATGAYERVSVPTGGGDLTNGVLPGSIGTPRLSHDARFAVFSSAQPFAQGSPVDKHVVWVRDRQQGTTVPASLDSAGVIRGAADGHVSDDGRFVVFVTSVALVPSDTNNQVDVYLRDLQSSTTTLLSVDGTGAQFAGPSHSPTMSGDGRYVAFATRGRYVATGGITVLNIDDVYLVDRQAGTVTEAAVGPAGEAQGATFAPRLSRTGRFLVFETTASNLVDLGGQTFVQHVYLRDLAP
jgi:Tol biopolymer transport system component